MRALILLLLLSVSASGSELWLFWQNNLWVDQNIEKLEALFVRASKAGYTHVLLADSKFAKLGDMDARYFKNVERIKKAAETNRLEIVPAIFPVGYSNDILWHDPNLIEALPVRDVEMIVRNGIAEIADSKALMKGGDFEDLKQWGWKDENVRGETGAAVIRDPKGANARISQKLSLKPFHQYHLSVRVKTRDFKGAAPEVKILADNRGLNFDSLGVKPTQDWTEHHVVFHSLDVTNANLYLGAWGANTGELWFDDAKLEETIFVNLVRRSGAPLRVTDANGRELKEGSDFEPIKDPNMGNKPWAGSYDVWHEPPKLKLKSTVPDGTKLKVSSYHGVTVNDDQAMICPSEPKTMELLRDQAKRVHAAWGAKGYMMSHDEIRVLNWCDACQKRNLSAGQIIAENARACVEILRDVNPGGRIYVWSDMFDPDHNAHDNYYLVRGPLANSWDGLDKDVVIVPWYFEKRAESLKFFAARGHAQIIAGYYDHNPAQIKDWLKAAAGVPNVRGVMYTTWRGAYDDLEKFAEEASRR